jgi:hypothetical protein
VLLLWLAGAVVVCVGIARDSSLKVGLTEAAIALAVAALVSLLAGPAFVDRMRDISLAARERPWLKVVPSIRAPSWRAAIGYLALALGAALTKAMWHVAYRSLHRLSMPWAGFGEGGAGESQAATVGLYLILAGVLVMVWLFRWYQSLPE